MVNKFVMLSCAVLMAGCASTSSQTISELDGQTVMANARMGEAYDTALTNAANHYRAEPECESRKVSLHKQRKAFAYDICAFTPTRMQYAGAPLSEVVYHFIDRSVVRVDMRAEGSTDLLDKIRSDIDHFYARRDAQTRQLRQGSYEWVVGDEVTGVREGTGANAGNIHVRLLDRTLSTDAPWLTVE